MKSETLVFEKIFPASSWKIAGLTYTCRWKFWNWLRTICCRHIRLSILTLFIGTVSVNRSIFSCSDIGTSKKEIFKNSILETFWIFYLSDSTRFLRLEHVWIRVRFGVYVVTLDTRINTWFGQDWSGHKIRNDSRIICEKIWSIRSSKSKNKNPQKSTTNKNFQRL